MSCRSVKLSVTDTSTPLLDDFFLRLRETVGAWRTKASGPFVEDCVEFLASVCDGAHDLDFQGYSVADANDGHRIDGKIKAGYALTQHDQSRCCDFLRVYHHTQLEPEFDQKFGKGTIDALRRNPQFRFKRALFDDPIPYFSLSEQSGRLRLQVPQAGFGERGKILKEILTLAGQSGVSFRNSKTFAKRGKGDELGIEWDKDATLALMIGDWGVAKFVEVLRQKGFAVDSRIEDALSSKHDALLTVSDVKVKNPKGNDFKILYAFVQARKPATGLRAAVEGFVKNYDVGWPDWDSSSMTASFPVGSAMMDDLAVFCERHKVSGFRNARHVVSLPENYNLQRRSLRKPSSEPSYAR